MESTKFIRPLKLVKYPDLILREKCREVVDATDDIKQFIGELAGVMRANGGIGIAAPQVGIPKRIALISIDEDNYLTLINPIILNKSKKKIKSVEGCLSIPHITGEVERFSKIKIGYRDINYEYRKLTVDGILSICIQHEIDHLDGILFIDKLNMDDDDEN